jgi:hypothetical protein
MQSGTIAAAVAPFAAEIRSHGAVIRIYDAARNVIETHEHKGDFNEW